VGEHRLLAPVAGEELVGPPAEQERVGALVHLVDERHGLAVEQRPGPPASLESAAAVLIRPAVSLHHSIDGNLRGGSQFHDRGSLLLGGAPRGRPLTPATNTSAPIRQPPGFLSRISWYAGCTRSHSATVSGRLRSTSLCARPVRMSSGTRSIAKTLTRRPRTPRCVRQGRSIMAESEHGWALRTTDRWCLSPVQHDRSWHGINLPPRLAALVYGLAVRSCRGLVP